MTTVSIAGIRFHSEDELPGLDDLDPADAETTVQWVPAIDGHGLVLGAPMGLHVAVEDGTVWLPLRRDEPPFRSWQLRQVSPVVAAWLGKLTLHASAVDIDGGVYAFVGASQVGKSTLAWELVKAGAGAVADDLLPVRFTDGRPVTLDGRPVQGVLFPLRGGDEPSLVPLGEKAAIELHLENGFGEHAHPETWARQFDDYGTLVRSVDHWTLQVPDDRKGLSSATVPWLLDRLSARGSG